ncbi:uncharacterized protein E0L32_008621 [Thyridium curvatum]|uniref:Uncharacterized protein n=1 Tax=Thyridium curvatum TaxID=1093900 RepID=A0A507AL47_9PEZI|nr:uncharacterized protein E0L32_008621 [Thyridium curvatum]TPX10402.1 hypothetical protein E0L32_008621 [Thyridium curvatum]
MRVSESSHVEREDEVVRRIEKRALDFQGWRGDDTVMEHPTIQRYEVDVFYNYHYDWDPTMTKANRVTTFNIYLAGDYTRGGTNSPYLSPPKDTRWCDVIECDEAGKDGYQGVVVKPIARSAIYWENLQFTQTVPHIKECAMLAF